MTILEVKNLSLSYQQEEGRHILLSQVNLSLKASHIYDLQGVSGSGKSSFLRALARMLDLDAGELFLKGVPSSRIPPQEWRKHVCLVPQTTSLVPGTIRENLLLPWKLKVHAKEKAPGDETLLQALAQAEMPDLALDRDVSQLSGGQAARISLLRVILTKPSVLLFDEVDAALDDASSAAISALTFTSIDADSTCLRIRHRQSDGFAQGAFILENQGFRYEELDTSAIREEALHG